MATSSDTSEQNNVKSRRPAESAFKQQRLPAWQPILTAGTVLPTFFVIGIAFIPVGIGLLYFSDEVKEHVIDYTFCLKKDEAKTCADYIKETNMSMETKCICELSFNLTEDFKADVYFYYGLSNFYQNHRRYVKSRDDEQLLGRLDRPLSTDCEPFAYRQDKPIAPCGAIANSMFNDTLSLFSQELGIDVPVNRTGIAWNSDKEIKFRNPDTSAFNGSLKAAFANYTKPNNWAVNVWELDLTNEQNNGFQNEDLIVWMRTAALPTFRKLYRRVDHSQTGFRTGLSKGLYTLRIEYNYPVTEFDGTKSFVISTTSLLGGKNPFLGVAYVVVGTLCLLLGIVLLIIHVRCSKRYYPTPTESFFLDIDSSRFDRRVSTASGKMLLDRSHMPIGVSKLIFPQDSGINQDDLIIRDISRERTVSIQPGSAAAGPSDESPLFPMEEADDPALKARGARFSVAGSEIIRFDPARPPAADEEQAGVSQPERLQDGSGPSKRKLDSPNATDFETVEPKSFKRTLKKRFPLLRFLSRSRRRRSFVRYRADTADYSQTNTRDRPATPASPDDTRTTPRTAEVETTTPDDSSPPRKKKPDVEKLKIVPIKNTTEMINVNPRTPYS